MSIWASGAAYEPYIGRWSRLVAREFIGWLAVPPKRRWLDVGCGTGALSEAILDLVGPVAITGVDASEDYLAYTRELLADHRALFRQGDAQALPFGEESFDATVSGLMLNFLPEPDRGVAEMVRVTRPGGVVAAYAWDYLGEMQLIRRFWDAATSLDTAAAALDEGRRFPLCQPAALEHLFDEAGLEDVAVRAIDVPTVFHDFDAFWSPFLGGQGPAPSYVMSLDEVRREALRDRLRTMLPIAGDGSIQLVARAWAVKGTCHLGSSG